MMHDLAFHVVELVPCPDHTLSPPAPLREVAFRGDAWLPDDLDQLRASFAGDEDLQAIADSLGRSLSAVRSKIGELGLRRNSNRPWTELDRAYLAQHYGLDATSAIAAALGRTPGAVYAQAGVEGLTEGNAPEYTPWEIAQTRTGYAMGVPVAQLAVLIGRPVSGLASLASKLGIKHANAPPDWSDAEQQRALVLAEEGRPYRQVAADLADEGFPHRELGAVGQVLRKLGYGRGWGRPWLDEEKALLRQAYERGSSLTPLRDRLGRSRTSIAWQAGEMGLQGTHARPNGWRTEPPWTDAEIAILRRDYGRVRTQDLADALGRPKAGVFNKAWSLGLRHGFIRAFTEEEHLAIQIGREHGLSLADLADALGRDVAVLSKYAIRMGLPFKDRVVRAPRTPRTFRRRWTVPAILALAHPVPSGPMAPAPTQVPARLPRLVALPGVPAMRADLLAAMHAAGLLAIAAQSAETALVAPALG